MARNQKQQREASEFEERVVYINRVSKTVKGGRRMSLVALVVVGDGKGNVGVGMGKSAEVPLAISKASLDAKKNMFHVPVTEQGTIPHEVLAQEKFALQTIPLAAVVSLSYNAFFLHQKSTPADHKQNVYPACSNVSVHILPTACTPTSDTALLPIHE